MNDPFRAQKTEREMFPSFSMAGDVAREQSSRIAEARYVPTGFRFGFFQDVLAVDVGKTPDDGHSALVEVNLAPLEPEELALTHPAAKSQGESCVEPVWFCRGRRILSDCGSVKNNISGLDLRGLETSGTGLNAIKWRFTACLRNRPGITSRSHSLSGTAR